MALAPPPSPLPPIADPAGPPAPKPPRPGGFTLFPFAFHVRQLQPGGRSRAQTINHDHHGSVTGLEIDVNEAAGDRPLASQARETPETHARRISPPQAEPGLFQPPSQHTRIMNMNTRRPSVCPPIRQLRASITADTLAELWDLWVTTDAAAEYGETFPGAAGASTPGEFLERLLAEYLRQHRGLFQAADAATRACRGDVF